MLEDLGSVNGTFCNGVRIFGAASSDDGDKISMGGATILKFTYQDAARRTVQQESLRVGGEGTA